MKDKTVNVELEFLPKQWELFNDEARFKVIAKGRRFGLTKGFSLYAISKCLSEVDYSMLWVDTIYGNINRYYERYFLPELKKIKHLCAYKKQDNILKINESYIDFRSADRPENIEGQSYKTIIMNEAGIILKDRRLWTESILPMVIDHKANVLIGGTPKGKWTKKNEKHLFYELYQKGEITKNKNQITREESQKSNGKGQNSNEEENRWKSFNYSTYENPLLDEAEIKEVENEIPYFLRQQEIYGKFIEENEAQIIKHEWWRYYQVGPSTSLGIERVVQSWDTAFKTKEENDFSVCTTWEITKNKFLLLHLFRERMEFPELKRKAAELFLMFKPSVLLIEDKA